MASQSTANNPTGAELSSVPSLHSFEFDKDSIGQIKTSVNQFRGNVSLPITFMTLPGRQDLDVKIAALYTSNVRQQVATWNLEAPTGILGLGWQIPYDYIAVNKNNSGSSTGDDFYLISNGSGNPLIKVGEREGVWLFQLRSYEFWDIRYDPRSQTWTIVREDGTVTTFGGSGTTAVQWGVKWGNWIGSSAVRAGQGLYAVAWNLATIRNVWGAFVTYQYDNVEFAVGSADGLKFTQASYVKTIVDSYGRTVTFNYGEKYGARNPSPRGIVEYQAQDSARPEPNAYQNKYETRYLDSVAIANPQGELVTTLQFTYDFVNVAPTGDPNYGLLWKRCLRSAFQQSAGGRTLPSMRFLYNGQNDVNPGALQSVVYPEGGTAKFTYKKFFIQAPKKITLSNPLSGSIPGVWHGSDYVVFTYCVPGGAMKAIVCSWDGRWVQQDITAAAMSSAKIDSSTLWVSTQSDSIAISYRNTAGNRDELFLYRKDRSQFGNWQLYLGSAQYLPVSATAGASTFIGGSDYVIAFNTGFTGNAFQGFAYDFQTATWKTPVPLPSSSEARAANGVSIAASANYYIVAMYTASTETAKFQIFYRDLTRAWNANTAWTNSNLTIDVERGRLLFLWNAQPAYAVATFVTGGTPDAISYSLRTFQWDETFRVLNASSPAVVNLTTTVVSDAPRYNVFRTIAAAAFVSNNPANQRNIGGDLSGGSSANWLRKDFTPVSNTSTVNFTSGDDAAVLCETISGSQRNQLLVFDPNVSSAAGWSFPGIAQSGTIPTVSANYLTVGTSIYFRRTDGIWTLLSQPLTNLGAPESVQNRAPGYIAWQSSLDSSARSYVVTLQNGGAALPVQLGGAEKIYVPSAETRAGTSLAGRFLISYPSSSSFDAAATLNLYNLDEGSLSDYVYDYPVAYLEILNPFDATQSYAESFFYANSDTSQIAFNPATSIAQYPLVYSVRGVKSTADMPPPSQPEGRSAFFYSNGLSPQASLGYPVGWIYNYQDVLNGTLLAQQDFNSNGILVQSQVNYWQVYTRDVTTGNFLWGAYVRLVRTSTSKGGVTQDSTSDVDQTIGLPLWQEQTYCDTSGAIRRLRTSTRYAIQVDRYKTLFTSAHYYSAVVQSTQSVTDNLGQNAVYIASKVTTWQNWADTGAARLAPVEVFQWTTPGTTPPVFDFGANGGSGWLSTSKIITRSAEGMIEEQIDSNRVRSSFIYDKDQRYLIAKFPNGSLEGGEVSYSGFEAYENDGDWSLGAGASVIPSSAHPELDAHTGTNSVRIEAASTNAVTATFHPADRERSCVFSAWVKKPAGFDSAKGRASWTIAVAGGSTATLEFPDTAGAWVYVSQAMTLAGSGVTISASNANSESYVLVDDVRFSPLSCLFEATPYDTLFWVPSALLGANGDCSRTVYDSFQQTTYQTNAGDVSSKITRSSFSRSNNEGEFSTVDPDATLELRPTAGGVLETFNDGDEWRDLWTAQPPGAWHVAGGLLTQTDSSGALRIDDPRYTSSYSIAATFQSLQDVTQPLGCRFGSSLTVQWDPETLRWQLLDGGGSPLANPAETRLFSVPATPFTAQLDAGQISSDLRLAFLDAGYPLPAASTVMVGGTQSKQWVITGPDQLLRYYLLPEGATIGVYQPGSDWTFFVGERTLLFWAGGQRIFSYVSADALSVAPELFFGNAVAISALITGLEPQARVNFDDSNGNALQSQLLSGVQAVVSQNLSDAMGRQAVRTKTAYVDPSAAGPLMAYRADFASIDWTSGVMTGLVAAAYPADEGFPYSRQIYETSSLERVVEQGMPGAQFRAGAHSTKLAYSADSGTFGLPPNQFYRTTLIDPNGDTSYEIDSQLQQVVGKVSIQTGQKTISNQTLFDPAGNPYEMRSPNYFDPPDGSTAADWVISQTFDYAGRVTSSKHNGRVTQLIYDPPGNLRFLQDAQGAAGGTYNYWKYDDLGRVIESGFLTGSWSAPQLQNAADTDPAWPPTPDTWRSQAFYDGTDPATHSIGRVHEVLSNNGTSGTADVTQTYAYDVFGNITDTAQTSTTFDPNTTATVDYVYDNVGNIVEIAYPQTADKARLHVYYRYGALNRVTAVSTEPDFAAPLATYSYDATGLTATESYDNGVTRKFGFNSPLWMASIADRKSDQSVLFSEQLSYTDGGYQGAGYYNGTIAATAFQSPSGATPYNFTWSYDALGQIRNGENAQHPDWNLGVTQPVSYDANGNFVDSAQGGQARRYRYFAGTQGVQAVTDAGGGTTYLRYRYDANGSAIEADTLAGAPVHDLTLGYDPGTKMTRSIADGAGGGSTLTFQYGDYNQRIVKEVRQGSQSIARKLYVRGTNIYPLLEKSSDGTETLYIFGPSGLVAMRRGGEQYTVLRDHLGSIRRVLDTAATIVASYDYLPFGTISSASEPSPGFMPYLFTGQEYDAEVGLYNYRARFYDSNLGRFLTVDPQRQFFSPYIYAANNPVLYIDPSGMFSFSSFFSAIGGILIGAVEVLIGVAIDVVAGVLEVITGGLSTPASVALAAAAGAFYGAGTAAITYSVFNFDDFSWKDYGIQMGIGALAGAVSFGFGAIGAAVAESATGVEAAIEAGVQVSRAARAASFAIESSFEVAGGVVATAITDAATGTTPGADLGWSVVSSVAGAIIPGGPEYKAGFGNLGKRVLAGVAKEEVIGVSVTLASNAAAGNNLDEGLLDAAFGGALQGTLGGLQVQKAAERRTKDVVNAVAAFTYGA